MDEKQFAADIFWAGPYYSSRFRRRRVDKMASGRIYGMASSNFTLIGQPFAGPRIYISAALTPSEVHIRHLEIMRATGHATCKGL